MIPTPQPGDGGFATSGDGTRIAWRRYGEGERAILFVPTWNIVDARVVGHQVEALAPHATVVTYDPRGAGASDRPETGYDFPLHAADALAVMETTGIQRAAIVTASRGINPTILLATDHPDRVDRIAAVAPYMVLDADSSTGNMVPADHPWRTDFSGWMDRFMRRVFNEPGSDEVIGQMVGIGLEATLEVLIAQEAEIDWSLPPRLLGAVTCPVLLIHGDADATIPVADVQAIADAIPDTRLELIIGGGHRPDIRSPDRVKPVLLEFLVNLA